MIEEPSKVYLILEDGERVDCLIEKIADDEWQATPVRNILGGEVVEMYADMLPAGGKLSFIFHFEDEDD